MPPRCSLHRKCESKAETLKVTVNYGIYSSYVIPRGSKICIITKGFGAVTNMVGSNKKEWIYLAVLENSCLNLMR